MGTDNRCRWPVTIIYCSKKFSEVVLHISGRKKNELHNLDRYYDWKRWARAIGVDGRFPLFTATTRCLKRSYMKQIFTSNMLVVHEINVLSGMPLCTLAAAGLTCNMELAYNSLKVCPSDVNTMN